MGTLRERLERLLAEMNERWTAHHLGRVRPLEEDELETEDDTLSCVRSDCMEALQTGNWRRWAASARHFSDEHALALDEGGSDFRELCHELGKLEARSLGFSLGMLRGETPDSSLSPVATSRDAPASSPQVVHEGDAALLLSAVYEEFCSHKTNNGRWKRPEVARSHDYDPIILPFIAFVGDKPLGALTLQDVRRYATSKLEAVGPAMGTKKRDFDRVKAFLTYARKHLGGPEVAGPLTMEQGYSALHESYEPFSSDDISRLFYSKDYKENSFKKASQFWLPLIGLYSGARLDEPASMFLKDIVSHEGIAAFYMSGDESNAGGKNAYAPRWLPIHPKLLEAGFLGYVELLRKEGFVRLFPDIGEAVRDGFGKRATTDFTEYRRSVGVGATATGSRSTKTYHSFRATVSTHLEYADVDGGTARRLVGHAAKDVHDRVYLKNLDQRWLVPALAALSKLDYGLSHPVFEDTDNYRKARRRSLRGVRK